MSNSTANAKSAPMSAPEVVDHVDCFNSQDSIVAADGNAGDNADDLCMADAAEDNSLKRRIARQQQLVEAKAAEISATQRELEEAKELALRYIGAELIEEVLTDPVWNHMESEEFRKKYLMHKVPGIRSMAELAHKLNTENQQLQELQQKMVQLHTDKQNNTKQPFELFNMIQKVEEKLKVAEAEVAEVKEESTVLKNELQIKTEELQVKTEEIILLKRKLQIKTDEAKALKSELAICKKKFEPDLLFGTFYDHTVNWNCNKRQLTKTGYDAYWSYAVSSSPLDRNSVTNWKVTYTTKDISHAVVGIIANKQPQQCSFRDPTSYVWGTHSKQIWEAGKCILLKDGWSGFKANDVLLFSYDPQKAQLSVTYEQNTFTMNVQRDRDYYHHCNFYYTGERLTYEIL